MFITPFGYLQKFFLDHFQNTFTDQPKKVNLTKPRQESIFFPSTKTMTQKSSIEDRHRLSSSSVSMPTISTEVGSCQITPKGDKYVLKRNPLVRNLVFSGGGAKGIAYPAILQQLEESSAQFPTEEIKTLKDQVENIAGSSIGAVTAAFIACGMNADNFTELMTKTDFETLKGGYPSYKNPLKRDGIPFEDLINTYIKKCILNYIKDKYPNINTLVISDTNDAKILSLHTKVTSTHYIITFNDLNELNKLDPCTFKKLYITAFCKEKKESVVFTGESHPNLSIATACRASASLPVLFKDVQIDGMHYVDGGLTHNLPTHIFEAEEFMRLEGEHGNNLETVVFAFDESGKESQSISNLQNPQSSPKQLYTPKMKDHITRRAFVSADGVDLPFDGGNPRAKQQGLLNIAHRYFQQVFPVKVCIATTEYAKANKQASTIISKVKTEFSAFCAKLREYRLHEEHNSLESLLFSLTNNELEQYSKRNRIDKEKIQAIKEAKAKLKEIAHAHANLKAKKRDFDKFIDQNKSCIPPTDAKKYFISELSKSLFKGSEGNDYKIILNVLIYAIDTLPMRSYSEGQKILIHQIRDHAVTAWRSTNPEAHEAALQQIAYKMMLWKSKKDETTNLPPEVSRLYNSIYSLIDQKNSGSKKTPSEIRFVPSKLQFTENLLAFFPEEKVDQIPEPEVEQAPEPEAEQAPEPEVEQAPEPEVEQAPEPEINHVPKSIVDQILPHIESFNSTIADQKYHIKAEEIARQIQELENSSIDTKTPVYFPKETTGLAHSFLISKNENDTYSILIKPNVKNKEYLCRDNKIPSEIMQIGSYKMVKKTGILINISADKKTVVSIERQVIVSRDSSYSFKNRQLFDSLNIILINDGFKKIEFCAEQKKTNRVIYTMPYLGEPISKGWPHVRYKRTLALALIDDVLKNKKNDIKPANILLSPEKDRIHIIDFSDAIFTFTPGTKQHILYKGFYGNATQALKEQARIFSLAMTLWELTNPEFKNQLNLFAEHSVQKLSRKDIITRIQSNIKINKILNSPFFDTVLDAYECRLKPEKLKQACQKYIVQ